MCPNSESMRIRFFKNVRIIYVKSGNLNDKDEMLYDLDTVGWPFMYDEKHCFPGTLSDGDFEILRKMGFKIEEFK